jgi:hypothetical protein
MTVRDNRIIAAISIFQIANLVALQRLLDTRLKRRRPAA